MADDIPQGSDTVPVGRAKAPAEDKQQYTGEIRRTNTDGTEIGGFLIDKMGSRIMLRGHKDPRKGHGYFLYGEVVVADHLSVPAIDRGE